MTTFYIYRLKIEEPGLGFRDQDLDRRNIILDAIREKPSFRPNRGSTWRIGNVQEYHHDNAVIFAFGRITQATRENYDDSFGDFVEEPSPETSHTLVAIDLQLQVCAIAHKSNVYPKIRNTVKRLEEVLQHATIFSRRQSIIKISRIDIPSDFLTQIENAVNIYDFEITFSLPNPFDVDRQFQRPLEELLREAGGEEGKVSIKAPNKKKLNTSLIKKLTQSAVSSGNKVKARIRSLSDLRTSIIQSSNKPLTIKFIYKTAADIDWKELLGKIREAYHNVRHSER